MFHTVTIYMPHSNTPYIPKSSELAGMFHTVTIYMPQLNTPYIPGSSSLAGILHSNASSMPQSSVTGGTLDPKNLIPMRL